MINFSTLGRNLKGRISTFSSKLSKNLTLPQQKFIFAMIYGILASQSSYLTEIARKLNEKITLKKTVERLSRHLFDLDEDDALVLHDNYMSNIQKHFDDETLLLVDDGDVAKSSSSKLESLCKVRDGSTGEITTGYWYAGVTALTAVHKQPIPVYGHLYSSLEAGYKSNNDETLKSLKFLSKNFSKQQIRVFDRGYDAGYLFDYLVKEKEQFIVRMKGNRHCVHKGKTKLISQVARDFKGKYNLDFKSKDGKEITCKVSITPIALPHHPGVKFNLIVCRGFGKEPLMLLTTLDADDPRLCVTITKCYLLRWRIEEFYRFKKQAFGFEKFLVRSLKSIRNLDLLINISIGFIGTLGEMQNDSIEVRKIVEASKRLYGLASFTFYAISDGLFEIFAKLHSGIDSFFQRPRGKGNPLQMALFDT